LFFLDIIDECTDTAAQPDFHLIAVLEIKRRILDKTNAFRRARENDRARF
jgi:hypothetical protein